MKKNKAVLLFLLRFFVSYLLLAGGYQWYLTVFQQNETIYRCDPITETVANQCVAVGNFLGYEFHQEQHPDELSIKLYTDKHYTARVIEGCNAMSIIILFWAFIIAFRGTWKNTLLFGIVGGFLIYWMNIARIVFLTIVLDTYPQNSDFWHQIIFPSIIYGFTFILWVVWVRYFAIKNPEDES